MSQNQITVFDTTLRDGEKSPGVRLSLSEKLEIAQALVDLGVDAVNLFHEGVLVYGPMSLRPAE